MSKKIEFLIIFIAILVLVLIAYALNYYDNNRSADVYDNIYDQSLSSELEMKDQWTWISSKTKSGDLIVPKEVGLFTISFTEGRVNVGTDCNSMGGTYEASKGNISFGPMMMTLAYCEGSQENQFAELLNQATGYRIEDNKLILYSKEAKELMIFQ